MGKRPRPYSLCRVDGVSTAEDAREGPVEQYSSRSTFNSDANLVASGGVRKSSHGLAVDTYEGIAKRFKQGTEHEVH